MERAWLAGTLWPDSAERQAYANLRKSLKDLRRALGAAAACLTSPSPHTLCLRLPQAADVVRFDAAIGRGDRSSLEEAVATGSYHGVPAAELMALDPTGRRTNTDTPFGGCR